MEDEDIASNMYLHSADPAGMDRKSCLYSILEYSVLGTGDRRESHID